VDPELESALEVLKSAMAKPWFRRAVGSSVIDSLRIVINHIERELIGCRVPVDLWIIEDLLDDYYAAETRIRYLIRELVRLEGGVELLRRIVRLYPALSPDLREIVDKLVEGADPMEIKEELVEGLISMLMDALAKFRTRLMDTLNEVRKSAYKCRDRP